MSLPIPSRSTVRRRLPVLAAVAAVAAMVAAALPAAGHDPSIPAFEEYGFQGEGEARIRDLDARQGRLEPTAEQQAMARQLGATSTTWNAFGTPHVLVNHQGYLSGPRKGTAVDAARAFVRDNAALFRLSPADVDGLEVLRDSPLYDSPDLGRVYREKKPAKRPNVAHSVLFAQRFGGLPTAVDGLLTIGIQSDGRVASVSSSLTGDADLRGAQEVDAAEAIRKAAKDVDLELGRLTASKQTGEFLTFKATKTTDVQRARAVALPTPQDGVRRAWEVTLLKSELDEHGNPTSFISFIDAESGKLWHRTNAVEHLGEGMGGPSTIVGASTVGPRNTRTTLAAPSGGQFSGATKAAADTTPAACGPEHKFEVSAGNGTITIGAAATRPPEVADDDIVIKLFFGGKQVDEADFLTSPEQLVYSPQGGVPPGTYTVLICPFNADAPSIPYIGGFIASPGGGLAGDEGFVQLPTWRVFPANPRFVTDLQPDDVDSGKAGYDNRELWCWDSDRDPKECDEQQRNTASRVPWDVQPARPDVPTLTTDGNNASTAISEASFLTPDTAANRPVSETREYDYNWKNAWFENSCDPTTFGESDSFVDGGPNDESAAVTNLFVQHNRMHDWSYYLGFTEVNYNMQQSNFGNTGPERQNDPELGSAQAGRRTPRGRDNANQITPQDGIAPITNQYLWQPFAGAFYAPCVDGGYDQAIVAHEYTHAITNRMVAGPNTGTGGTQGLSESWSDLGFAGYFTEFGITAGAGVNPYVLAPYAVGDPVAGIRNYAMNDSPLNYSGLAYDQHGLTSNHAPGEMWSAVNFDILVSLSKKYDRAFPSSNKALQESCARGERPAQLCPGNRRWNQIQFDSFLLLPAGATMISARDMMLAADRLRFNGANQKELWDAFARRGLGQSAKTTGAADLNPTPGWDSPLRVDEARIRFAAPAGVTNMEVFVGKFEARITPIADTVGKTELNDVEFFVPGRYEFIARADGFGAQRFTQTFRSKERRTVTVPLRRNLASVHNGARATGDGVNLDKIIDDTEETNWASLTPTGTASEGKGEGKQVEGRQVTVALAGDEEAGDTPHLVREVLVSAATRETRDVEGEADPDPQSRFSALRSFELFACNSTVPEVDCTKAENFAKIFTSEEDAFPGGRPRPRAPDFLLRPADVTDVQATHIRLVVVDNQCTGAAVFQAALNPDDDPANSPDCDAGTFLLRPVAARNQVRAAELQVYGTVSAAPNAPGNSAGDEQTDDSSSPVGTGDDTGSGSSGRPGSSGSGRSTSGGTTSGGSTRSGASTSGSGSSGQAVSNARAGGESLAATGGNVGLAVFALLSVIAAAGVRRAQRS